jgi:hypothetical protein
MLTYPQSTLLAEYPGGRPQAFVPTVYEDSVAQPLRWKYHVLTVDTREQDLPSETTLNELGQEGWILVGLLDERATGRGAKVYYYFACQSDN